MGKNIYILLVLILIFASLCDLKAQGGSNYSIFGIGEVNHSVGAAYDGLANTAIAMPLNEAINTVNPALWSIVGMTRLQAGYKFNQHINTKGEISLKQNNGKVSGLLGIFSIDTSLGIAASFGILPYSSTNYLAVGSFTKKVESSVISGQTTYQKIGGTYNAYIGASCKLIEKLALGLNIYSIFGKTALRNETYIIGDNAYKVRNTTDDSYSGFGLRAGLLVTPIDNFSVGAFIQKPIDLKIKRNLVYGSDFLGDTTFSCELSTTIPAAFGIGVSYLTGKFLIGADISFQDFTDFSLDTSAIIEYRNSTFLSLGIARIGNQNPGADYLDKVTYKIGAAYKELYFKLNEVGVNEIYGALGMSFPLPGTGILDAAINIGTRGQNSYGLINEVFGRLTIDFSIGETWFRPFRPNY